MELDRVIEILKQFRDREGNSGEDIEAFSIAIYMLHVISVMGGLYVVKEDKNK